MVDINFAVRLLLLSSAFSLFLWLGYHLGFRPIHSELLTATFLQVCDLVDDHYYEDTPTLREWVRDCRTSAQQIPEGENLKKFLQRVQRQLYKLPASHLEIWDPESNRLMWLSEARETGVRARSIEDDVLVIEVIPFSPAERAGVKPGDQVLKINDKEVESAHEVRFQSGDFMFRRGGTTYHAHLTTEVLKLEEGPVLVQDDAQHGRLKIASFVAEHFEKESWITLADEFSQFPNLTVDVRGNPGGDFVAMLRALSPFLCHSTYVGELRQPRETTDEERALTDDESLELQSIILEGASRIELKTFDGYPCYRGRVTVLIDGDTSSTAEIFAQAFKYREHARILGRSTSGSVLLAAWYPLLLGQGYLLSVPQSLYVTPDDEILEGEGVRPDRALQYDLKSALSGIDSWVLEAMKW